MVAEETKISEDEQKKWRNDNDWTKEQIFLQEYQL